MNKHTNKEWWNNFLKKLWGKKTENAYDRGRKLSNELDLKIIKKGTCRGSDGFDYYSKVIVTSNITGESLPFNCRNVFDYGFVINPEYSIEEGGKIGGIADQDRKNWIHYVDKEGWRWIEVRAITEFENKCLDFLHWKFYSYTEIRM